MGYQWLSGVFAAISVLALILAFLFLVRRHWFLGWLKGTLGLLFLLTAAVMGLSAYNLGQYHPMERETRVATISFDQLRNQLFKARVVLANSDREKPYEMAGDLWQFDARIIQWQGMLARFSKPGCKPGRLQGRYITMEDEEDKAHSVYELSRPDLGFNLWLALKTASDLLAADRVSWYLAKTGKTAFLPMADGAMYAVYLTSDGLIARPENSRATIAVENWE